MKICEFVLLLFVLPSVYSAPHSLTQSLRSRLGARLSALILAPPPHRDVIEGSATGPAPLPRTPRSHWPRVHTPRSHWPELTRRAPIGPELTRQPPIGPELTRSAPIGPELTRRAAIGPELTRRAPIGQRPRFLLDLVQGRGRMWRRGRKSAVGGGRGCFGMKMDRIGSVSGLGC
ncbi:hypothetical protein WMY93_014157 [Mugilogobius chulae]|uniref:C-type natriuretic peptide n=1 Tax=Mugilogobius chulae TaxID=88201 RepID=A0AAW0NYF8_9GOBI